MLIQPEKAALVKARLRKAVHLCEKLWTRFVSAGAKGLKNAEKWALRILKRAEGWLGKLPAQAVKEKIKAAFTQECLSLIHISFTGSSAFFGGRRCLGIPGGRGCP